MRKRKKIDRRKGIMQEVRRFEKYLTNEVLDRIKHVISMGTFNKVKAKDRKKHYDPMFQILFGMGKIGYYRGEEE